MFAGTTSRHYIELLREGLKIVCRMRDTVFRSGGWGRRSEQLCLSEASQQRNGDDFSLHQQTPRQEPESRGALSQNYQYS
jgi:hypothetical protein